MVAFGLCCASMSMSEKAALEKFAVIEFCKAFNRQFKADLTYIERRDPPLPDIKCGLNGNIIFIEVAHLYGAGSDAKRLLGRKGKSYPSSEEQKIARLTPLHIRIGQDLSRILKQKSGKTYTADPAWLLVRNANLLWGYSDFKSYLSNIEIPAENPFLQIWLLCGPRAESKVIKLSGT